MRYLFKPSTLLKLSLFVLILVGLVNVGGSFYSGTQLWDSTNKNWVYIIQLVLGTFSFTIGVVGLFGTKYLRPVLYMIVPLWICTIVKAGFFYSNSWTIVAEGLLPKQVADFFKGFAILEIVNKSLAIILIIWDLMSWEKAENKKIRHKMRKRDKEVIGCLDSWYPRVN